MTTRTRPRAAHSLPWFLLRAQWAAGLLPLLLLTEISRPALLAATTAFVLGLLLDRRDAERPGWNRLATPLVLATALAALLDLAAGSRDLLSSASLLVLGIQSIRFLLPKTTRDGWQLCAISFLEFLAAAASTTEIQFAALLLLFLGLSAGAMWALHLEEEAKALGEDPPVRAAFATRLVLLSAGGGVLLTAILFVTIPRVGIGQILRHLNRTAGLSGFSETIALREVTSVKMDRRVVARIEFPELAPGLYPEDLYLKGAVYSAFDGSRWTRRGGVRSAVPRSGLVYVASPPPPGKILSLADILLEPADDSTLFVYGNPVTFEGNLGSLRVDPGGSFHLAEVARPTLRYRIRFTDAAPPPGWAARPRPEVDLAVPPRMERVRKLGQRVAGGAKTDSEKAGRILRHFRSGFRYTLDDPAATIEDFLFGSRAGYCEHYATGLALLLRSAGIPARVAAGYLGGEWSDLGRYLIVRQSDAHAWTEGWIDGRWVTLDATPPLGAGSPFHVKTGFLGITLDWARQRWNKYVVNFSLGMQAEAVSRGWRGLRQARWSLRRLLGGDDGARPAGRTAAAVLIALIGAALARELWKALRLRRSGTGETERPLPRPYARLLRALAAAGHRRSPGTSLERMVRDAVEGREDLLPAASRFLRLYHLDRFGPGPLPEEDFREAGRLADLLRRGIARPGAA